MLAAWRALRRRRERVLPGAEVALMRRRTRIALGGRPRGLPRDRAATPSTSCGCCRPGGSRSRSRSRPPRRGALAGAWRVGARASSTLARRRARRATSSTTCRRCALLRGHPVRLWRRPRARERRRDDALRMARRALARRGAPARDRRGGRVQRSASRRSAAPSARGAERATVSGHTANVRRAP